VFDTTPEYLTRHPSSGNIGDTSPRDVDQR
jgi:hypothetical protein